MNKATQKPNHPKTQLPNAPTSQLRIIFFGTPDFIEPVISVLDENFDLAKVIRSPQQLDHKTIQELINLNVDLFVVASYGKILPARLLEIPKLGAINIHPSLLPKYRGPSPIQTAILNGDEKTGVSIIKMDEKMDHGPILEQIEEPVLPIDTFQSLSKRLFKISADMLKQVITHYNEIKPITQDEKEATYTKLLTKQDGFIDLNKHDEFKIENLKLKIHAFHPWPGVWTKSNIGNQKSSIIKLLPDRRIQVEGKKPMNYKDFINGYPQGKDFLQKLSLI